MVMLANSGEYLRLRAKSEAVIQAKETADWLWRWVPTGVLSILLTSRAEKSFERLPPRKGMTLEKKFIFTGKEIYLHWKKN